MYGKTLAYFSTMTSFLLAFLLIADRSMTLVHGHVFYLPTMTRYLHENASSYFGFSVSVYQEQGIIKCLVGAPQSPSEMDEDVITGQTYRIPLSVKDTYCTPVPIATTDYSRKEAKIKTPAKSVWLGSTIASTVKGRDSFTLACDARHIDMSTPPALMGTGVCALYLPGAMQYVAIEPCDSQTEGACMAGFSASVIPGGVNTSDVHVALGMPGSYLVEGNIFVGTYGGSKVNKVTLKSSRTDLENRGYNLGYSVVMANLFPGDVNRPATDVITSSPMWFDNKNRGVVIITDIQMNLDQLIFVNDTLGHMGSFFGYCLEVGDFNADGIADIVVGAPFFTNFTSERSFGHDQGRVYIFFGGESRSGSKRVYQANANVPPLVLTGTAAGGQFGHSVALLKDVDGDGVDDLAVGCPGCGPEKTGAVYVYLGAGSGAPISTEPFQIILASDLALKSLKPLCPYESYEATLRPFKSFGWSLSSKYDVDKNGVPDLAVGDFKSAQVVLFKSRVFVWLVNPVWHVEGANNTLPWTTNSGALACEANCRFNVSLDVEVQGLESFLTQETIVFDILVDLDSLMPEEENKRLKIVGAESTTGTSTYLEAFRMVQYKMTQTDTRRRLRLLFRAVEPLFRRIKANIWLPIVFNVTVVPREMVGFTGPDRLPWILHPRRSERVFLSEKRRFDNPECGPDSRCVADLFIQMYDTSISVEDVETIYFRDRISQRNLTVYVGNKGENAYKARLRIAVPYTIQFEVLTRGVNCKQLDRSESSRTSTLECDLGDPMATTHQEPRKFDIALATSRAFEEIVQNRTVDELVASAEVTSGNQDAVPEDNTAKITYKLRAKTSVKISSSQTDRTIIDSRNYSTTIFPFQKVQTTTLGPQVNHIFLISNDGPSPAETVFIKVKIPVETSESDQLVYLLDEVRYLGDKTTIVPMGPRVISADGEVRGECFLPSGTTLDPLNLNAVEFQTSSIKTASQSGNNPFQTRSKRNTKGSRMEKFDNSSDLPRRSRSVIPSLRVNQQEVIRCGQASAVFGLPRCLQITCRVDHLKRNDAVRIVLQGWLWADTFFRYKVSDVAVQTEVTGWVDPMTYKIPVTGPNGLRNRPVNLTTLVVVQNYVFEGIKILVLKQIPIWPIVLGAMLGLLALTLIIVVMWKCGFFKRNRITKEQSLTYM